MWFLNFCCKFYLDTFVGTVSLAAPQKAKQRTTITSNNEQQQQHWPSSMKLSPRINIRMQPGNSRRTAMILISLVVLVIVIFIFVPVHETFFSFPAWRNVSIYQIVKMHLSSRPTHLGQVSSCQKMNQPGVQRSDLNIANVSSYYCYKYFLFFFLTLLKTFNASRFLRSIIIAPSLPHYVSYSYTCRLPGHGTPAVKLISLWLLKRSKMFLVYNVSCSGSHISHGSLQSEPLLRWKMNCHCWYEMNAYCYCKLNS